MCHFLSSRYCMDIVRGSSLPKYKYIYVEPPDIRCVMSTRYVGGTLDLTHRNIGALLGKLTRADRQREEYKGEPLREPQQLSSHNCSVSIHSNLPIYLPKVKFLFTSFIFRLLVIEN